MFPTIFSKHIMSINTLGAGAGMCLFYPHKEGVLPLPLSSLPMLGMCMLDYVINCFFLNILAI